MTRKRIAGGVDHGTKKQGLGWGGMRLRDTLPGIR